MVEVVLASTLHEPEKKLTKLIIKYGHLIKQTFESSYIVVTPTTHEETIKILNDLNFKTSKGSETIIGTYKKAIKYAITNNPEQIFYCDFDRILHWAKTYPNELKNTPNLYLEHDFLLIGRTSRAFKTHPETQTLTEGLANQVASKILGFKETRDVISACWRLKPRLAKKFLKLPIKNTYGFYSEWPIIAWRQAKNPGYVEVEGLEWETPDRYQKEIEEKGYDTWLQELQTRRMEEQLATKS